MSKRVAVQEETPEWCSKITRFDDESLANIHTLCLPSDVCLASDDYECAEFIPQSYVFSMEKTEESMCDLVVALEKGPDLFGTRLSLKSGSKKVFDFEYAQILRLILKSKIKSETVTVFYVESSDVNNLVIKQ
ncbi:hypothetical protein AsGV079 [Agrotis segetum granulovirus]|uniref:Uncharacterized protein n=1 Tax=Agrotis segetum granulosis virus TaxID=10464 RepID=A0A023MIF3_GVAS|nr:hypothetical protein AsGV079 [Agrotis segetum granulovirus]AHN92118.1 hypothetical protein AsGV079 [Agrotis segetum granulovirus]AKN63353.1 hypothetical protein AsGV079 [Agrotis segetum granulovirus]